MSDAARRSIQEGRTARRKIASKMHTSISPRPSRHAARMACYAS